jgi:hypothetical protein
MLAIRFQKQASTYPSIQQVYQGLKQAGYAFPEMPRYRKSKVTPLAPLLNNPHLPQLK